jgi:NTE family protein
MEIAEAVRMSMSIPLFFEPVVHKGPDGTRHVIVDGGMLSNFPVWLFDCRDRDPRWPTFGLLLVEPEPRKPIGHRLRGEDYGARRGSLLEYLRGLAQTLMEAHDRLYLDKATFARTIPIPTLGIGTTEFEITRERVRELYDSGHRAASDFLDQWDFDAYIEEFRRGKHHSRRTDLVAHLAGK